MTQAHQAQREWLQALLQGAPAAAGPEWLARMHAAARERLEQLPPIDRKQEAWRYTGIDTLLAERFVPPPHREADLAPEERAPLEGLETWRLVFVDGRFQPHLSALEGLPEGVIVGDLRSRETHRDNLLATSVAQASGHHAHLFTALNEALADEGAFIQVPAGTRLERPIEIVHRVTDASAPWLITPRNLVLLGERAEATLIERFSGRPGTRYFHDGLTDLVLGRAARLVHYRIQDESREAWHLSSLRLDQAAESRYEGCTFAFGARWSRTEQNTVFEARGAECHLAGVYLVGEGQLCDFHLDVRHEVPECRSSERYKGVLFGKGRAVFDGRILVAKDAQRTDAHLSNNNLMLVRDAEVDTKPQLEIYADDVQCSHGTSVGQLDPQQVFYLRSRGLPEVEARRLLCLGFASDLLEAVHDEALRHHVESRIRQTLVLEGG
ncbi:MAG: Fe-S cluster assembly protein SufD [Gammaproteobacteria bacterium]|nr:MAG: Fe-S cluster assembly protein SufD [Gammaproteobacteria bacterium]